MLSADRINVITVIINEVGIADYRYLAIIFFPEITHRGIRKSVCCSVTRHSCIDFLHSLHVLSGVFILGRAKTKTSYSPPNTPLEGGRTPITNGINRGVGGCDK